VEHIQFDSVNTLGLTVPCKRVQTIEAAEQTAVDLGWPAWISAGPLWRMRVENPDDLPLAWAKAQKHLPQADAGVLVQADVQGDRCRLLGCKVQRAFYPVEILSERLSADVFGVPMEICVPAGLAAARYSHLVELSKRAGAALPQGGYYVEMEWVVSADAIALVGIHASEMPDPVLVQLMQFAQGIDLETDVRRAAAFDWPRSAPRRDMAAAVCWLTSHSGVVESISGIEAAEAVPGVQKVVVRVRPGDILGHVTDIPSRDRLGYLLATGPTRIQAIETTHAGAGKIVITTKTTLD